MVCQLLMDGVALGEMIHDATCHLTYHLEPAPAGCQDGNGICNTTIIHSARFWMHNAFVSLRMYFYLLIYLFMHLFIYVFVYLFIYYDIKIKKQPGK